MDLLVIKISVAALIVLVIVGTMFLYLLDSMVYFIDDRIRHINVSKDIIIATINPREEDVVAPDSCWINKKDKMVFVYNYNLKNSKYIWRKIIG